MGQIVIRQNDPDVLHETDALCGATYESLQGFKCFIYKFFLLGLYIQLWLVGLLSGLSAISSPENHSVVSM